MIRRCFTIILLMFLTGCTNKQEFQMQKLPNIEEAFLFYKKIIKEAETFYDKGTGHWGQNKFGYRNMLTECYLRFDGYELLQQTTYKERDRIKLIINEIIMYYLRVADSTGTGVWGIPAETRHPEFGEKISYEIQQGNSQNGWIYILSGNTGSKAGIFYSHGQVLADLSKSNLRTGNPALLPYITNGAQWITDKDYDYGNINYFAAALKGLVYAYAVTKNKNLNNKALEYLTKILDTQNPDGSFGGKHDSEAGYHGIIVSCLAVARKYLPENSLPSDFNSSLSLSVNYLQNLQDVAVEDRAPFVVQAWYYISCLADDNLFRQLTYNEWNAYTQSLQICINKAEEIEKWKQKNNYIYQKEIQTCCLIGSTIVKFHFDRTPQFY